MRYFADMTEFRVEVNPTPAHDCSVLPGKIRDRDVLFLLRCKNRRRLVIPQYNPQTPFVKSGGAERYAVRFSRRRLGFVLPKLHGAGFAQILGFEIDLLGIGVRVHDAHRVPAVHDSEGVSQLVNRFFFQTLP